MSSKDRTRAGGKYTGSHTTVIPVAGSVCDVASKCEFVAKISLGIIIPGVHSAGKFRLKISEERAGLKLQVTSNTCKQIIWVYVDKANIPQTKKEIADGASAQNIEVSLV